MLDGRLLTEARQCESDWVGTGLLNGLTDPTLRATTAILLENQRLINELSTDTGDVAQFKRISIPLVRRIYPQLIANKIVSVQPLLGPTGLVFYLRARYSSNKGATRGATQTGFPGDDNLSLQQLADGTANLDIYYSDQTVVNETQSNAGGGTALTYTLEKTPLLPGTLTGTIYVGSVASANIAQTFTVDSNNTFTFSPSGSSNLGGAYVSAGSVDPVTGIVSLTWSANPSTNNVVFGYQYNLECNQDLPEINMAIESESITSKTRKLKAAWSYEAQQDVRSQHNLELDAEITQFLAQEVNLEIDREILTDLRMNAGTVASWDFNTALGQTIKEKYESLYVKLIEISNIIHRKTLRGGANWIVTSPEVAAIFESATAGFAPQPSENFTSSLGVQYVGTVASRWRLYKDPLFPTNQILMGYKGDSYMDSGYYFCPYVPLTQTPIVLEPEGFCPRKGLLTRYGKKLLREGAKFYARISVQNFALTS